MNVYPEHSSVPYTVAFTDDAGQAVSPTHVTIVLKDGDEEPMVVLHDGAPDAGAVSHAGVIAAEHNVSDGEGELTARLISVTLTLAGGRILTKQILYGIEPVEKLVVCRNSFQTYVRAVMEGSQMVNLVAFNSEETPARQVAALIEAYDRIINIPLIYNLRINERTHTHRLNGESWDEMTQEAFEQQLPMRLRRALRQAQIMEADMILQGNVLARKHAEGIQSETIGESSVTLRAGMATNRTISNFTMSVLAPFLDSTVRIGRA